MSKASIVLLTYNGEKYLDQVLQMIGRQRQQPFEVLAIDSSSNDSTQEILRKFQVTTKTIPRKEFSHPITRNLAARMCSGRYIVFLTQDAIPADACWLECILRPFEEFEDVAGVFSRQIPRPGTNLLEANDLRQDFPSQRIVKKLIPGETTDRKRIFRLIKFSNAGSAYDRQLLVQNPFDEQLEMAEDQEWSKRMLEQNYTLIYEPSSVVVHSHDHDLKQKYFRSLHMGKAFSRFLSPKLGRRSILLEGGAFLANIYLDLKYIYYSDANIRTKCKWMALSPLHRSVIHYAYRKGWNSTMVAEFSAKKVQEIV